MTQAAHPGEKPSEGSLRAFCVRLLESGSLEVKLAPPEGRLQDRDPGPALSISRPARDPEIALTGGAPSLPRLAALTEAPARAACLARFAHHELMAVELFAWALLRWPELPAALRQGWLAVLLDEQRHCRMYLGRLAALGSQLSEHPATDYFWRHIPAIDASPHGPRAFLCAMGLTLEQANLDFSLLYRDAFRQAGDEAGARVLETVHEDEIRHVGLAARWLDRLSEGKTPVAAYEEAVPFPLSAARAKGRHFDTDSRRRAGLAPELIDHVRNARSTQERRPGRARPAPGRVTPT